MPFGNPIVAGSTLIRTAIQSPNYVAGVSGWQIARDGSAEFNNVTVRGTFVAGTLTINAGGLEYIGPTQKMNIDDNLGFVVQETTVSPALTNYAMIDVEPQPSDFGGILRLGPPISTQYPTVQERDGSVSAIRTMTGIVATPKLQVISPGITAPSARARASITLSGENDTGTIDERIDLSASVVATSSDFTVGGILRAANRVLAQVTITPVAGVPTSLVLVYGVTLTGTVFYGQATASTSVVGTVVQGVSVTNITSTQCTVWVTRTNTTNTVVFVTIEGE